MRYASGMVDVVLERPTMSEEYTSAQSMGASCGLKMRTSCPASTSAAPIIGSPSRTKYDLDQRWRLGEMGSIKRIFMRESQSGRN